MAFKGIKDILFHYQKIRLKSVTGLRPVMISFYYPANSIDLKKRRIND